MKERVRGGGGGIFVSVVGGRGHSLRHVGCVEAGGACALLTRRTCSWCMVVSLAPVRIPDARCLGWSQEGPPFGLAPVHRTMRAHLAQPPAPSLSATLALIRFHCWGQLLTRPTCGLVVRRAMCQGKGEYRDHY